MLLLLYRLIVGNMNKGSELFMGLKWLRFSPININGRDIQSTILEVYGLIHYPLCSI